MTEMISVSHIEIKRLHEDDIAELETILSQHVFSRETGEIIQNEIASIKDYMWGDMDESGRIRTYLVAKDQSGNILGCMAYAIPDPDMIKHFDTTFEESAELLNAFVSNEVFRGGGVGRKLFKAVCAEVKSQGKKELVVNSGPRYQESWGFYDKVCDGNWGFIKNKYGQGRDAKTWIKHLA